MNNLEELRDSIQSPLQLHWKNPEFIKKIYLNIYWNNNEEIF
jgi:hypothetical protein